jgi:hypothetical protein
MCAFFDIVVKIGQFGEKRKEVLLFRQGSRRVRVTSCRGFVVVRVTSCFGSVAVTSV